MDNALYAEIERLKHELADSQAEVEKLTEENEQIKSWAETTIDAADDACAKLMRARNAAIEGERRARETLGGFIASLGPRGHCGDHWVYTVQVSEAEVERARAVLSTPTPEAKGCAECDRYRTALDWIRDRLEGWTMVEEIRGNGHTSTSDLYRLMISDIGRELATPPPTLASETGEALANRVAGVLQAEICSAKTMGEAWWPAARAVIRVVRASIRHEALEEAVKAVRECEEPFGESRLVVSRREAVTAIRTLDGRVKP